MNIDALLQSPFIVQVHTLSALSALVLGVIQMVAPKGTIPHRSMGVLFVLLMLNTAMTVVFLRGFGNFSIIHIFVPVTLVGLYQLVKSVRNGGVGHRKAINGLFYGALIIPSLFAFLPGRLMNTIFLTG
jgi:uncharacterized membrane protein